MRKRLNGYRKYFLIAAVIYLLDVFGVFTHIFVLDYNTSFHYPQTEINSSKDVQIDFKEYNVIHNPKEKCADDVKPRLVLLVKSALGNGKRRDAIRRTWGYEQRFSDVIIRRIFLLGAIDSPDIMENINSESRKHNDILQSNFIDSYFNNTIKTMIGIGWAREYCGNSPYFMFADDDYYVSMKNVLKFLGEPITYPENSAWLENDMADPTPSDTLFAGYVMQTAPHRHKTSKWYVTLQEYPFNKWPPYVTAGAFILSRRTLCELHDASATTPAFRFDDIYLSILALRAGVTLTHCKMFHFDKLAYSGPEDYRHVLAMHGYDYPSEMARVWNECRSARYA